MEVALVGALISTLGFGFANIVIKKSLSDTSIGQTLLGSMVSGSFFLFLFLLTQGLRETVTVELIATLIAFAIGEVALYLTLYKAFSIADVTVASGILSVYPVFSTIYAVLVLKETVQPNTFIFITLMVLGAIILSLDWTKILHGEISRQSLVKGLSWVLICLGIHAVYFPALGNLTSSGQWEFKLFGIKLVAAIILAVLFILIRKAEFKLTKSKLGAVTLLGLLEVIAWVGLSYASSNSTGMIAIIVALGSSGPIVTAITARFYLKEKLHILQYVGILLVVGGLTLIALAN